MELPNDFNDLTKEIANWIIDYANNNKSGFSIRLSTYAEDYIVNISNHYDYTDEEYDKLEDMFANALANNIHQQLDEKFIVKDIKDNIKGFILDITCR